MPQGDDVDFVETSRETTPDLKRWLTRHGVKTWEWSGYQNSVVSAGGESMGRIKMFALKSRGSNVIPEKP